MAWLRTLRLHCRRYGGFLVVSRNSAFAYKGRQIDIRQAARELGVRYVLEGSVRKIGVRSPDYCAA